MKNVTPIFQVYREHARHLSNSCYKPKFNQDWDTRENFDQVKMLLFEHLVLHELGVSHDLCSKLGEISSVFRITPSSDTIPVMINRDRTGGYWDHPKTEMAKGEAEIAFIDYFDWDEMGTIDFRYIRGRIISSKSGDIDGYDVLIESIYVDINQIKRDNNT